MRKVYAWARDEDLLALSGGRKLDLEFEDFAEIFNRQARSNRGKDHLLYAILDESDEIIGRIGLFGLKKGRQQQQSNSARLIQDSGEPKGTELGIVIGQRSAWGKGYGREALKLLVEMAFDQLLLESLVLYTLPNNLRAQRAFAAVGFESIGLIRRFNLEMGAHDEMAMVIHSSDRDRDLGLERAQDTEQAQKTLETSDKLHPDGSDPD